RDAEQRPVHGEEAGEGDAVVDQPHADGERQDAGELADPRLPDRREAVRVAVHRRAAASSAICTAFSAAPLRIWSPTSQNASPGSRAPLAGTRPTATASCRVQVLGTG